MNKFANLDCAKSQGVPGNLARAFFTMGKWLGIACFPTSVFPRVLEPYFPILLHTIEKESSNFLPQKPSLRELVGACAWVKVVQWHSRLASGGIVDK